MLLNVFNTKNFDFLAGEVKKRINNKQKRKKNFRNEQPSNTFVKNVPKPYNRFHDFRVL